jgi:hypothetical protein
VSPAELGSSPEARYQVPHWSLLLGFIVICQSAALAIGWAGTANVIGTAWTWGRWVFGVLWTILIGWSAYLMLARVVYRVELRGGVLRARSSIIRREVPVRDLTAVIPGWRQPLWRRNGNWYVIRRQNGRPLLLWGGKGVYDFLGILGQHRPDLMIGESHRSKRLERAVGRSGFSGE